MALAIVDLLIGVFLRYVMTEVTDYLDLDMIRYTWVEEVGEFTLAWMTLIGAAVGIAERVHFTSICCPPPAVRPGARSRWSTPC